MDLFGAGRTLVMAVVNMTPDSFSDGGSWLDPAAALARARLLISDGADLLDLGGESTRPGATRITPDEECARIIPTVQALADEGHVVSVDTVNSVTARRAVAAGARLVNDISGGSADPDMYATVAELGVPYVVQHSRGEPATMVSLATYTDLVGEMLAELEARLGAALAAGIAGANLIVDPGLGFAKEGESNWQVLAALERFQALGYPVLVGASRKRFLAGMVPAEFSGVAAERDHATAAVSALAAARGVWAVRVHEARASRDAVRVAAAWAAAGGAAGGARP